MANHHILNQQGQDISPNDNWHCLAHEQLPEGIALANIKFDELLHKQEKLDIILPILDILTALTVNSPLLHEALTLINHHSSRLGIWLNTDNNIEQLDELVDVLAIDDSLADGADKSATKPNKTANAKKAKKDSTATFDSDALHKIELVVIYVPAFADGRGFSLAKHLRLIGYQGEIRMAGAFGIDQLAYLSRSGVDSFVVAEEQFNDHIIQAFNQLPTAYHGNNANQLPMFR